MPFVLIQLGAFGFYTLGLIFLAGQAFDWKENRSLFYLGDRKLSFFPGIATFCATWMSGTSVVGFTMWIYQEGYVAFTGSVLGWLLGLCLMPFFLKRLREKEALSLPELLEKIHGDSRLRYLGAGMIMLVYLFYVIIQFRVFGSVVSELLHINALGASVMVYLFVVYTTFGGFPSVVRSDMLNMGIILLGITVALGAVLLRGGNPLEIHILLNRNYPEMLRLWSGKWQNPLLIFLMMLSWGMGGGCESPISDTPHGGGFLPYRPAHGGYRPLSRGMDVRRAYLYRSGGLSARSGIFRRPRGEPFRFPHVLHHESFRSSLLLPGGGGRYGEYRQLPVASSRLLPLL